MYRSALLLLLMLWSDSHGQDGRATHLSPLDVTVDANGETAEVILAGTREKVTVDLRSGSVKHRKPADKNWQPYDTSVRGSHPDRWGHYLVKHPGAILRASWDALIKNPERESTDAAAVYRYPRTQLPTTQMSQGWVFVSAIQHVPMRFNRFSFAPVVALDEPQRGYADPTDIVGSLKTNRVFVTSGGADLALAIDLDKLAEVSKEAKGDAFDLTKSRHFIVARLPTGPNPRRLGLSGDGKTLVVCNYLGDSLTVIDAENLKVIRQIPLGGPEPDEPRRGEILFNSAKLTFQGQFTCASCHPNGGTDGLNWDLTRDGVGNFLNTRSLHGVRDTAPYGWLGSSKTLEDRVAGTLRTLHRHEPQGTEVADLVAYLKTLDPAPPLAVSRSEAAVRGHQLFHGKAKCASCHRSDALDDELRHDVGTRLTGDQQDLFDTPSLRGVGRTAPYLHHGQAQTLEEVFTKYNPRQRHGAAHLLSESETADLIAFLKGL